MSGRVGASLLHSPVEGKVRPHFRETLLVLHRSGQAAQFGLVMAAAVDGSPSGRGALFQNKHRSIWPAAGGDKGTISGRFHKDVGEFGAGPSVGVVFHSESGREINPLAIVARQHQPAIGGVLRGVGCRASGRSAAAPKQCDGGNPRPRNRYEPGGVRSLEKAHQSEYAMETGRWL